MNESILTTDSNFRKNKKICNFGQNVAQNQADC